MLKNRLGSCCYFNTHPAYYYCFYSLLFHASHIDIFGRWVPACIISFRFITFSANWPVYVPLELLGTLLWPLFSTHLPVLKISSPYCTAMFPQGSCTAPQAQRVIRSPIWETENLYGHLLATCHLYSTETKAFILTDECGVTSIKTCRYLLWSQHSDLKKLPHARTYVTVSVYGDCLGQLEHSMRTSLLWVSNQDSIILSLDFRPQQENCNRGVLKLTTINLND